MGTGLGRYVVDAVLLEGRSAREVAAAHGISKTWIYELIARYRSGGYGALEPRSRRPRSCVHGTSPEMVQVIVELRRQLQAAGHDAGAATIAYHLAQQTQDVPSLSLSRRSGAFSDVRALSSPSQNRPGPGPPPAAATSRSHGSTMSTMSRHTCPGCPDTSHNGGGGIRTLVGGISPETVFETLTIWLCRAKS